MKEFFLNKLRLLTPVFITEVEGMPHADPEDVAAFGWSFIQAGTPAFRAAFMAMVLVLEGLCLITRRKSLYSLEREERDEFVQSLYSSRFSLLSAIPTLVGTPIYMGHYGREDLQERLGFDVRALREEAAMRGVER